MAVNFDVDFAPLGKLGEIYRQNQQRQVLEQGLQQMGLPGNMSLAQLAIQQRALEQGNMRDARDFGLRKDEIQRAQSNTDRSHGLAERQLNATLEGSRVQPGWRPAPGGGIEFIPNGPADPEYIRRINDAKDKGRNMSAGDITKLSEQGGKFSNINEFVDTFDDKFAGDVLFGGARNWVGRTLPESVTTDDARQGAKWWQGYDRYRNVVRNELFGSALTAPERAAFDAADITPNMAPSIVKENLKTQQKVLQGAMKRQAGAMVSEGYRPDSVAKAYGVKLEELGVDTTKRGAAPAAAAPAATAAPAKITDKAQYDALPPGTPYIAPDGSVRTKK